MFQAAWILHQERGALALGVNVLVLSNRFNLKINCTLCCNIHQNRISTFPQTLQKLQMATLEVNDWRGYGMYWRDSVIGYSWKQNILDTGSKSGVLGSPR